MTTVASLISSQGTELLDAIIVNDRGKFTSVLNKRLKKDEKILRFCSTEMRHKTRRENMIPAELAVSAGSSGIVRYMLSKGLSPNHGSLLGGKAGAGGGGGSLLLQAVARGAVDAADVLLEAGADANMRDAAGEVPLHVAVRKLNSPMVRVLLSRGADPCLPDRLGDTPLHAAAHSGHLMIIGSLLKYNADVYQKGRAGAIAPQIAAREGHAHVLELFCRDSALCCDINVCVPCFGDGRAKAPIHIAAERGHHESLSVLVEDYNAGVNVTDSDRNTALHYLVLWPYNHRRMRDRDAYVQSANILLAGGGDVNAKNKHGDTCLHLAVMNGYQSVVQILLEFGADPTVENKQHLTASDVIFSEDSVTRQALRNAKQKIKAMRAAMELSGGGQAGGRAGGQMNPFNPDAWRLNQTMDIDDEFMLGPSASRVPSPQASTVSQTRPRSRSTTTSRSKTNRKSTTGSTVSARKRSKSVDERIPRAQRLMVDTRGEEAASAVTSQAGGRPRKPKRAVTTDETYAIIDDKLLARRAGRVGKLERAAAIDLPESPHIARTTRGRYMDSSLSHASTQLSPSLTYRDPLAVDTLFQYNTTSNYAEINDQVDKTGTGHATRPTGKPPAPPQGHGDAVKVSMIPGKPGALEVEYGGKTLEICVNQEDGVRGDRQGHRKIGPHTLPKPSKRAVQGPSSSPTKFVHRAQIHAADRVPLADVTHGSQSLQSRSHANPASQTAHYDQPCSDEASDMGSSSSSSGNEESEPETVIPAYDSSRPRITIGMRQDNYQNVTSTSTFV